MGIRFLWDDSYSVGDSEIDDQHRRMFDMADSLPENLDRAMIGQLIVALFKHTRNHFDLEERMMLRMGYPRRQEHVEFHNELIGKLNDTSLQTFETDQSVFAFKKFLYDWVIDHITHHDKDFFDFARQLCAR